MTPLPCAVQVIPRQKESEDVTSLHLEWCHKFRDVACNLSEERI